MVIGREHEADARFGKAGGYLRRCQIDARTECFKHIGTAGAGRNAAPAVFGHLGTRCRRNEHRRGGDVEGVGAVAAGADDIDKVAIVGDLDACRQFAHDLRGGGNFAHRFFFDAQASENGGDHHRRDFAAHDLAHRGHHFVVEYFAVFDDPR